MDIYNCGLPHGMGGDHYTWPTIHRSGIMDVAKVIIKVDTEVGRIGYEADMVIENSIRHALMRELTTARHLIATAYDKKLKEYQRELKRKESKE